MIWCPLPAHPRAGGENLTVESGSALLSGSSPRGRGKRSRRRKGSHLRGLIPARAGKTATRPRRPSSLTAHPRAGGENVFEVSDGHAHRGSSPRGRGKRSWSPSWNSSSGFIPARAGKTIDRESAVKSARAHPRAGGENGHQLSNAHQGAGSSPRGRGKLNPRKIQRVRERLIPARAGKTYSQPWPPSHP